MYKELVKLLKCPCCGGDLELIIEKEENGEVLEGHLVCLHHHTYRIFAGVVDFGSVEQKEVNNWSVLYQEVSYEELDAEIENRKTENQKKIEQMFLEAVIREASTIEKGFLLDVASGRGMLLQRLLESVNEEVHTVASDLSFQVLMYDRMKFQQVNPKVKVSYVACDATNLPFKDHSVDRICSFAGFVNMGELMEKAIEEASRVLKSDSLLVNSSIYMQEESSGYQEVKKLLEDNGMEMMAKWIVRDSLLEMHQKYFKGVSDVIAYEGIAEPCEGDLLPYPGTWFADAVILAKK